MSSNAKFSSNFYVRLGWGSIAIAIGISFILCWVSAFRYVTFDIGPDPDQIRDGFVYMEMWNGTLPILGPRSSIGGYSLPPLYYYFVFPWTILGANPVFQVLPNALSTVLAVPAIAFLTYQLLENVDSSKRWLLSGLASLWCSLLYGVVFISTFQWNPTPALLFLILWVSLFKLKTQSGRSQKAQGMWWAISGVILAFLVSFHSSTLFVTPVVFAVSSLVFAIQAFRQGKIWKLSLPAIEAGSAFLMLIPYWRGEISRNFANTKAILRMVLSSGSDEPSPGFISEIWERLVKVVMAYLDLGHQLYFPLENIGFYIATVVLVFSAIVSLWRFSGNTSLWGFLWILWGVYFYAASSFEGEAFVFYYKLPILIMPIMLVVVSLAYLPQQGLLGQPFIAVLLLGVFLSCSLNAIWDVRYLQAQFGSQRLMSTRDLTQILSRLEEGSTICDPRIARKREEQNQYAYISEYVLDKTLATSSQCQPQYYVIHPKRALYIPGNLIVNSSLDDWTSVEPNRFWPYFDIRDNSTILQASELAFETETARVFQIEADDEINQRQK